ncbi:Uncharacterized protein YpgQ [Wickerhamiella sorbophila]|uniref:Uncharacterized protein YpgQ n=1 Tax=Wickerhamiella sorbophila TaxID=45607 RepID=A0A2T0FGS4_9ASCO|nr:Uncharacterized protein YpgQ [Wickerhamiella sorbophila]XP_024664136.1 Uncharacterized protein YpgQ [Wickerhamiella sorbophila]PRT53351.1 Uncharacterized protein YpgQ [Wickerhamiella sorbophila]PRT54191.1 Uncharacterized protein YpgQ [Wickerhamiella sorbophila]
MNAKLLTPPDEWASPMVERENNEQELLGAARMLTVKYMESYDPSHDQHHIDRVVRMAERLAGQFNVIDNTVTVLGAMFHDIVDHKYVSGPLVAERIDTVTKLMADYGMSNDRIATVLKIIRNTGYSIERKLKNSGNWTEWHETCREYHCVQDADRLDAIGAIGIFRVGGYACIKGEPLISPNATVISAYSHFFDKLLALRKTLKTPLGQKVGERRQLIMEQFVAAAQSEYELWDFQDIPPQECGVMGELD